MVSTETTLLGISLPGISEIDIVEIGFLIMLATDVAAIIFCDFAKSIPPLTSAFVQ